MAVPLALTLLALPSAAAAAGTDGGAGETCDRSASPAGSDTAPGTPKRPLATAQALVDALAEGETGCLRAGEYAADDEIKLETPGITLRSYPGERATLRGRIWVTREAPGSTLTGLDIDGTNSRTLPSPTINGDRVNVIGNDITNGHTSICLSVGSPDTFGRARGTFIAGNVIHDCGSLPATNFDHGIYVNSADETMIVGNTIFGNADRGIQLYPDAQGSLIAGNVIAGNGEGVLFGGSADTASSDNLLVGNSITGSTIRGNVESSWGGPVGTGNFVLRNCLSGGADPAGDTGAGVGFTGAGNLPTTAAGAPCAVPTP